MSDTDRREAGFQRRTRVSDARAALRELLKPHDRTTTVPVDRADGRVIAKAITAARNVPHYDRAAMDGYAVQATDTFGASDRSPERLHVEEDGGPGRAVRVHTGSAMPTGTDAVVMIEHVDERDGAVDVFDAVAECENVGAAGEDVREGQALFEVGHRLRPSDLGLLRSIGLASVPVFEPPTVGVIPTGEELVTPPTEPEPGEIVETNGLTVSRLADRWGAAPTYREVVTDDPAALRAAIQRDLVRDVVVTTGGSSVGARDLLPDIVDELGEVVVHGVALKPGHPVAIGVVEETPIVMLPGYPVACIVNAVQFLRPALKRIGRLPLEAHPAIEATLERKIRSEPGVRTFARVTLDDDDAAEPDIEPPAAAATPTRASGAGVLSSVALADGWVVVPESREGIPAGETVAVQRWEWSA